jgi:4-hydroxy-3-methylbut-2-enyl diphosphate reductase
VARRAGFCFGVKRAMDLTLEIAHESRGGVYTFGPIIHNPQVIDQLRNEGVLPVDAVEKLKKGKVNALIIRTHGIPCQVHEEITTKGIRVIDATCPFVKKAQNYAKSLCENGYQVIILGDKDHPEVRGLVSYAGKDVVILNGEGPLPKLKPKVGIVVQTTQPVEALKKVLSQVILQAKGSQSI